MIAAFFAPSHNAHGRTLSPKSLMIHAILIGVVLGLCACAAIQHNQPVIDALADAAGYVAYRAVPNAQPALAAVCLLSDIQDPAILQASLKELLGQVWLDASKLTTQDGHMAVLTLNNLAAGLGIQDENQVAIDSLRSAVAGLCRGVNLARAS